MGFRAGAGDGLGGSMCALAAAPGALGNAGGLRMALPLAVALVRPCKIARCELASGLARCTTRGLTQPLHARARQQRHAGQQRQQRQHSRPSRLTSAAAALLCVHRPLHGLVVRRLRVPSDCLLRRATASACDTGSSQGSSSQIAASWGCLHDDQLLMSTL